MAVVYKARQKSLNRIVAVKALIGSSWGQPETAKRLRQEAKGLSLISHPNVVKVIDFVETPVILAIILEYIEGESLASRLKRSSMAPKEAATVGLEIVCAMAFVHQRGLLHRDIKPANVLLDQKGAVKVADFGLVKEHGNAIGLTATGEFFGTPSYMAPEQADGRMATLDVRTDVYGIGATLYEMLCGRPPFVGVSKLDTLNQVQHRDPVPLRVLNPEIPRDLETICHKCLEKRQDLRFSCVQELADELERFQRGAPIQSRAIGPVDQFARWCRRRPAIAGLAAVLCFATVTITALLLRNNQNLKTYNRDLTKLNAELKRSNQDLDQAVRDAKSLQRISEAYEQRTKDALYVSDINRAAIALNQSDTREAASLIERHIPEQGERDRRGLEWWYLNCQVSRAGRVMLETGKSQYLLCYSPDRRFLASAGADAVVRLFDPGTGYVSHEIPTGQLEINGLAFSPDGKELATSGDDGTVRIWNLETLHERLNFQSQPGKSFQIVYTHDGSQIITCGDNPTIRGFDSRTGLEVFTLSGHEEKDVQSLLLSRDGKTLFSTGNDHKSRVWNLETRSCVSTFEMPGDVVPVEYDNDRGILYIGDSSGELQAVSLASDQVVSVRQLDKIQTLAVHPKERLLAAGDGSGQIRLRTLNEEGQFQDEEFQPWHAHQGGVNSLVWSPDGTRLISTGNDGRVMSWSLAAGRSVDTEDWSLDTVGNFCLIPNTNTLFVRSGSESEAFLFRWDWVSGEKVNLVGSQNYSEPVTSPDGRLYASIITEYDDARENRHDRLFLGSLQTHFEHPQADDSVAGWQSHGELHNIDFAPDSKTIAVSCWIRGTTGDSKPLNDATAADHTVWLLNISDVAPRRSEHETGVPVIEHVERIPVDFAKDSSFLSDGGHLILINRTGIVKWNVPERRMDWVLPRPSLNHVATSPDGRLIAAGGSDRQIFVVNAADGTILFQSANHRAEIRSVTFSPDSRQLATSSSDGVIKLWQIATGQELLEFLNPGDDVRHLEFTGDGRRIVCQLSHQGVGSCYKIRIINGSQIDQ